VSRRPAPNKKELAEMKVLSDLGHSPTAIARKIGKSHHTVIKYLNYHEIYDDPEVKRLIEQIRAKELEDLFMIGAKARKRIHELLDEGKTKMIETVACMDRSFQQRRLVEDLSTDNIDIKGTVTSLREKLRLIDDAIAKKNNEEEEKGEIGHE